MDPLIICWRPVGKAGKNIYQNGRYILNHDDIKKYNMKLPSTFNDMGKAMQADFIRLHILYEYGGIWLDASIKLYKNFDWLLKDIGSNTDKYFQPKLWIKNYYENWFIVSLEKNNPNILKQLNLMLEIGEYFPNHDKTYIYDDYVCLNTTSDKRRKYYLYYQVQCFLNKEDETFELPEKITMNTQLTMFPYKIPFIDIPLTKYTSGTRNFLKISEVIKNIIAIIIVIIKYIFNKKNFKS